MTGDSRTHNTSLSMKKDFVGDHVLKVFYSTYAPEEKDANISSSIFSESNKLSSSQVFFLFHLNI
jgi:hypothetical protein